MILIIYFPFVDKGQERFGENNKKLDKNFSEDWNVAERGKVKPRGERAAGTDPNELESGSENPDNFPPVGTYLRQILSHNVHGGVRNLLEESSKASFNREEC